MNIATNNDLYKALMSGVIHENFPDWDARFELINRGKKLDVKSHMVAADLRGATIDTYAIHEEVFSEIPGYNWYPCSVFGVLDYAKIETNDGEISVVVEGPWKDVTYLEVPILYSISQQAYRWNILPAGWKHKARDKAQRLHQLGIKWADFGTRRRFSQEVQDTVVGINSRYPGFVGTSNMKFANKYNLAPIGTYAHEGPMAMQAIDPKKCNTLWIDAWNKTFPFKPIALTDTTTTEGFCNELGGDWSQIDGFRIDSGNPMKSLETLASAGTIWNKKFVFSDQWNVDKIESFAQNLLARGNIDYRASGLLFGNTTFGIGTNLTNDVGHEPLNIVMKLTAVRPGKNAQWVEVAKLTDDPGKASGSKEAQVRLRATLPESRR